ncbi:MAG: DUF58 domain-containing protein [Lachnospiraceae bacterium]|jgi:uncharacterized protein (DUF58 family)
MAGRKAVYLLLTAITAYIGLMYDGPVPGILLGFEILLWFLLFASTFYLRKNISLTTDPASDGVVESGEKAKQMIRFHNKGRLPVTSADLVITVRNRLDDVEEEYEMNIRCAAGSSVRVPFTFSSTYCGVVRMVVEEARIHDYLSLFTRRKKLRFVRDTVIMPHLYELQTVITEDSAAWDEDSDEFDKHHPGDDPSEIFQMREYRQGDKMSRVNWKMSARLDTIVVKDLSRPISNSVALFLDLRYRSIDEAQSVFELCYSLSMSLLDKECHHRIIWCRDASTLRFEEAVIRTGDDLTEAMAKLLTHGHRQPILGWTEYTQDHPKLPFRRVLCITSMDPEKDMLEFLDQDSRLVKSVLTIDNVKDLIEI